MRGRRSYTTRAKADAWEVVKPLLDSMRDEFKELSKKRPEGALSKPKIRVVNRLLTTCREVLQDEESLKFLDLLDVDEMPQNSDVILMLSQYVAAMDGFRGSHYDAISGWFIPVAAEDNDYEDDEYEDDDCEEGGDDDD